MLRLPLKNILGELDFNNLIMRKLLEEYKEFIFGSIVIIIIAIGIYLRDKETTEKGVFAIAKVKKYRPEADGASLFIDIYIGDKIYSEVVNQACSNCVDSFFYVKILKQDPSRAILYLDSRVPNCILKQKKVPIEGWKEIPHCYE